MDSTRSFGRVTSSDGDVDLNGDLVGRIRENGTVFEVAAYSERPGLDDRLIVSCGGDQEQAAAVRRLLRVPS